MIKKGILPQIVQVSMWFILFGIVFALNVHIIIPKIIKTTKINPFIVAQVVNTLFLFIPIFTVAVLILKKENLSFKWINLKERLSFKKIEKLDFVWMFCTLLVAIIVIFMTILILTRLSVVDVITGCKF
jgi:hypothetical protein